MAGPLIVRSTGAGTMEAAGTYISSVPQVSLPAQLVHVTRLISVLKHPSIMSVPRVVSTPAFKDNRYMKRIIFVIVTGALAILLGAISRRFLVDVKAASQQYTPATLTERRIAYKADSSIAFESQRIIAMRADGSQATFLIHEPRLRNIRTIEMADGFSARIIEDLRVLSLNRVPEERVRYAKRQRAAPDCAFGNASLLRMETLHGTKVYVFELEVPQETAQRLTRITEWRAPEYGCFPLRSTLEQAQQDGSFLLVAENTVTTLQNGEPNPWFFNVPKDYEQVTSAELTSRHGSCSMKTNDKQPH